MNSSQATSQTPLEHSTITRFTQKLNAQVEAEAKIKNSSLPETARNLCIPKWPGIAELLPLVIPPLFQAPERRLHQRSNKSEHVELMSERGGLISGSSWIWVRTKKLKIFLPQLCRPLQRKGEGKKTKTLVLERLQCHTCPKGPYLHKKFSIFNLNYFLSVFFLRCFHLHWMSYPFFNIFYRKKKRC